MKRAVRLFLIIVFPAGITFTSIAQSDKYPLAVGAYPHNDTVPKTAFLASGHIAEAVDDFGFEIVLSSRNIHSWSCRIMANDSVIFFATAIKGAQFPAAMTKCIRKQGSLLQTDFFDISLKTDTVKEQSIKRKLRYYLE